MPKRKVANIDASTSASSSQSLNKKPKIQGDQNGIEKPEKRLAKFKPKCPQNILDRVHRVMSQRFFMIDRTRQGDELRETFKVLGSTGNVYTVIIDNLPSCDCPDALKGNHCKHILFVFLKVLGVPLTSSSYYQKALLSHELADIFDLAPAAPNSAANVQVREAYAKAAGGVPEDEPSNPAGNDKRIPKEEDDCPICYETMGGPTVDVKNLVFCETCGNALHTECFRQWARTARDVTCVWCRASWSKAKTSGSTMTTSAEGYLNLGGAAGLSPVRDTSSYYRGSRGSRGWDYRPYR